MASTGRPWGFGSDLPIESGRARGSPHSWSTPYLFIHNFGFLPNHVLAHVSYGSHLSSLFDWFCTWHVAHCEPLNMCQVSRTTLDVSKNVNFSTVSKFNKI